MSGRFSIDGKRLAWEPMVWSIFLWHVADALYLDVSGYVSMSEVPESPDDGKGDVGPSCLEAPERPS